MPQIRHRTCQACGVKKPLEAFRLREPDERLRSGQKPHATMIEANAARIWICGPCEKAERPPVPAPHAATVVEYKRSGRCRWTDETPKERAIRLARCAKAGEGIIYAIADESLEYVKIGWAKNDVLARLTELQIGNPRELHVVDVLNGSVTLEKAIHAALADRHVRGEWFQHDASKGLPFNWLRARVLRARLRWANRTTERVEPKSGPGSPQIRDYGVYAQVVEKVLAKRRNAEDPH